MVMNKITLGFGLFVDAVDYDFVEFPEDSDNSCDFSFVVSCSDFDFIASDDVPSFEGDLPGLVRFGSAADLEGKSKDAFSQHECTSFLVESCLFKSGKGCELNIANFGIWILIERAICLKI